MRTEPLMKFNYRQGTDGMMHPEIQISENPQTDKMPVGRFGKRWKDYMMEMNPHRLSELVAQGMINEIILKVDEEAEQEKEELIQRLLIVQPIPDIEDTLQRASHMNMITKQAEEIVMKEVVLKIR
ncbi:TnpV protein [Kineothrix alysoides]|uniref:TnpV protein n=1 Tax=Kineothrix alysoides TaxID=1469948 RepID=UPI0009DDEB6C